MKFFKFDKKYFYPIKRYFTNGIDHDLKNETHFLDMVKLYFDEAANQINIPRYYIDLIKHAKAVLLQSP